MGFVIGFLRTKWGGVLASGTLFLVSLGLLVALLTSNIKLGIAHRNEAGLTRKLDASDKALKVCEANLHVETANTEALNAALVAQGERVTALAAEANRRKAEATRAAQDLRTVYDSAQYREGSKEAARILNLRASGEKCDAAFRLMTGNE